MALTLPSSLPNQNYVQISAIAGGHITLPDSAFVSPADPKAKRYVPSLSFLITHPGTAKSPATPDLPTNKPLRILFDLGLRQQAEDYIPLQQKHLENRRPYSLFPGVPETLKHNSIALECIDLIILSHVHYDHHGDPELFPSARFIVGPGAMAVLQDGLPPELGSHQIFQPDLLPSDRTNELPPASASAWTPVGPFPQTLDLLGDGSLYVIDTPGHLPGHVNLLCRLSPERWVCLAGDAFHDERLLSGEREVGTWTDGQGRTCCIHLDREKAEESIRRLRVLGRTGAEIIAAHDEGWERRNQGCFLPGQL
jgi:glyoxylase-like metal-dependent hydrolase (beta-lactamase superfamily II)